MGTSKLNKGSSRKRLSVKIVQEWKSGSGAAAAYDRVLPSNTGDSGVVTGHHDVVAWEPYEIIGGESSDEEREDGGASDDDDLPGAAHWLWCVLLILLYCLYLVESVLAEELNKLSEKWYVHGAGGNNAKYAEIKKMVKQDFGGGFIQLLLLVCSSVIITTCCLAHRSNVVES